MMKQSLAPNTLIAHYRLLAPLGAGGMGEVYLAEDTKLGRKVALKLLPEEFTRDPGLVRRFEQEARAASALNHPNILTIFEIGEANGAHYIATEFIDGQTLRERLNGERLAPQAALDIATEVAAALTAAHEAGIVHRDIKPENVMLRRDGIVKILDFGLAKLKPTQLNDADSQAPTQKKITDPGTVMGTVGYMAPEQVRGQETDHRADIFAFGVILFEMLSGQRPFRGSSAADVMSAILKEEPPEIGETSAKVSPQLEKIVRRCLEKQPERRFHSAHDLGFALEAILSGPSGENRSKGSGRRERLAWIVAAALGLSLLALSVAYIRRPEPEAKTMRLSVTPPERTSFGQVAVSPDGKWLAFNAATGGKIQIWLRALDTGETKPLTDTERANYPFWSPDSRWIGFFAPGKLKKIEISGGPPVTVCDARAAAGGAWNRDGVILFSSLSGIGLLRVPATGGAATSVLKPDLKSEETAYTAPWFLPDGRHFLYTRVSGNKEISGIYLGSLDGGVNSST